MTDIKLFHTKGEVTELRAASADLEKGLQTLIESNLDVFLGVRFLGTEYATGKTHSGRIDTLGIDEDGSPVIIEYKRTVSESVINQGLFYLDWLMDHKAEFELVVQRNLGSDVAAGIDWQNPRLICVASDFTKYDEHAVSQIDRNISLIRYKKFGDDLVLFELVNATTSTKSTGIPGSSKAPQPKKGPSLDKSFTEALTSAGHPVTGWYEELRAFILGLGDDVQEKTVHLYVAFKRIKNFCCVVASANKLSLYLKTDPTSVTIEPGFTRDVTNIGHWATGNLEITVDSDTDVAGAKQLIAAAYEAG